MGAFSKTFGIGVGQGALSNFPQSLKNKFLFLWTGKFNGNNLLSDLNADVITVTGKDFATSYIPEGSAATFKMPNTTDYQTADKDTIWFNSTATQRAETLTELIAYDFNRTFIDYEAGSPHNINKIGILKAGAILNNNEINELHKYFKLSIYWTNVLNVNGVLKANRQFRKSVWVANIRDGNTWHWNRASDTLAITKNAGNYVSAWRDSLGSAIVLTQATDAKKPFHTGDSFIFDGVDDVMRASYAATQPEMLYMVIRQITWTNGDCFIDGYNGSAASMSQSGISPQIIFGSNSLYCTNVVNFPLNTFKIIRVKFNSGLSSIQINADTPKTAAIGTLSSGGITLGRWGFNDNYFANFEIKELFKRKIIDSDEVSDNFYNYLKIEHSL